MSGSLVGLQSGTLNVASGAAGVFPIGFGYYPVEGSRAITLQYSWTTNTGFNEDLSQLVAKGIETTIQGAWIDNSSNGVAVTLFIPALNQLINVPAYSQGIFPVFFTGTPGFQISVGAIFSGGVTRVTLINTPPQASGIWSSGLAPTPTGLASVQPTAYSVQA